MREAWELALWQFGALKVVVIDWLARFGSRLPYWHVMAPAHAVLSFGVTGSELTRAAVFLDRDTFRLIKERIRTD